MLVFAICWLMSLISMIVIDYRIGSRARVLNAWSLCQRLLGRSASAGQSRVYAKAGMLGELLGVMLVTISSGAAITLLIEAIST